MNSNYPTSVSLLPSGTVAQPYVRGKLGGEVAFADGSLPYSKQKLTFNREQSAELSLMITRGWSAEKWCQEWMRKVRDNDAGRKLLGKQCLWVHFDLNWTNTIFYVIGRQGSKPDLSELGKLTHRSLVESKDTFCRSKGMLPALLTQLAKKMQEASQEPPDLDDSVTPEYMDKQEAASKVLAATTAKTATLPVVLRVNTPAPVVMPVKTKEIDPPVVKLNRPLVTSFKATSGTKEESTKTAQQLDKKPKVKQVETRPVDDGSMEL